MMLPLIIIIVVIVIIFGWIMSLYNGLVAKRNIITNAFSDIDVQLKRRYDLIPNLVETVKGYSGYEQSVLENITAARTAAMSTPISNVAAKAQSENVLSGALKNLFAVSENYPQLRASENFQQLQSELSAIENDIQSARRYFNAATREYNTGLQSFPANMVAGSFGFTTSESFGAAESERENVKVSF